MTKVYTVSVSYHGSRADGGAILIASSLANAHELAQVRAHAWGLHIYRWEDDGLRGFAKNSTYAIKEYEVDEVNLK